MAIFYDPFMRSLEKVLIHHRSRLLQQTKGVVLEVGAGTGVNFTLYPKNVQVYAIEPSVPMFKRAVKVAQNYPNIKVFNIGIEDVLQHPDLHRQFDFITSMLVLCTIPTPEAAAQSYYKLLKNDGKLLVLEHIHSEGKIYGKLQKLINPVWRPIADGCNLIRRQDIILKKSGFKALTETYFSLGTDWYEAVMIKNKHDETL